MNTYLYHAKVNRIMYLVPIKWDNKYEVTGTIGDFHDLKSDGSFKLIPETKLSHLNRVSKVYVYYRYVKHYLNRIWYTQ